MEFCPRCGKLMVPIRKDGKVILKCTGCGYEKEPEGQNNKLIISHKVQHSPQERGIVVIEGKKVNLKATVKAKCPKCGYNRAYFWMVQTRAADEPSTRFFKCARCGYVWREYD